MHKTIPLDFKRLSPDQMRAQARSLRQNLSQRRSVRDFSSEPIPMEVIHDAIDAAAQSPSGANKQPWTFVVVTDPKTKREIRIAAEAEEQRFYEERASQRWLEDLTPLGTDASKPFLEQAPALIVLFAQHTGPDGSNHYYVKESVGIAAGVLLATLHLAGLATLTHTPSPMAFLAQILQRPSHERAYLLIPVGYPCHDCRVPNISRKSLKDVMVEV